MSAKHSSARVLHLFAALTLLVTGTVLQSSAAASTAQDEANGGLWSMGIGARTIDAQGNLNHTVGAHFTVTAEDGAFVGECTLPEPPDPGVPWWNCRVDVPSDRISLIWEDLDSIPAGYAPVVNPIAFDPTTYETGPHNIGAFFDNVLVDDSMEAGVVTDETVVPQSAAPAGGKEIAIITRDPANGGTLPGACYALIESGAEACDDDGDGQIDFAGVSPGTQTVHQSRPPTGYEAIADTQIVVDAHYPKVKVGYIIKQAPEQSLPGTRNVSIVFVDSVAGTKIVPSPICVTIGDASELGCDEILVDGQIGFTDVQEGTHNLAFSNIPAGWQFLTGDAGQPVTISGGVGPLIVYVEVFTGDTNTLESEATGRTDSSGEETPGTTGTMPFTVSALSCENTDRDCWTEIGARFTVTTEDGEALGECTLADSGSPGVAACSVPVPPGSVVIVTEDVSTITPGFAPLSNPMRFDTAVGPRPGCSTDQWCHWGPTFRNGRDLSRDASSGLPETKPLVIWSNRFDSSAGHYVDEIGARFTVTTEDGDPLGECTLVENMGAPASCSVDVPVGGVVIVTQDPGSITPGFFPESNPIRFNTTVEQFERCAPCHWGPDFHNGPRSGDADPSSAPGASTDTVSGPGETWSASVQVGLCDAPPNSGVDPNCQGVAGVVVNVALASGTFMGSCTTGEPISTPWGGTVAICTVEGLPFNADFVASQELSTIPEGYEPANNSISLHVGGTQPGGGDQATFTFFNVRQGSPGTSASTGSETATLLITFRGCPEGFDPNTGDFWAECTIPLDAPDASFLFHGGDGQGGINIVSLDRLDYGAYVYTASPATMNLELSGLDPVLRDGYQVFGADSGGGGHYSVNLVDGETREVWIFYYYE